MNSMPSKNQLPYEGTYITKPDENATYYTYDRGKVPFRISGQFGTGLYGKIEAGDIEAELGFKAYLDSLILISMSTSPPNVTYRPNPALK